MGDEDTVGWAWTVVDDFLYGSCGKVTAHWLWRAPDVDGAWWVSDDACRRPGRTFLTHQQTISRTYRLRS